MYIQDPIVPCERCGRYLDLLSGHEVHVEMQLEAKGWKKVNGEWFCPPCVEPAIEGIRKSGYTVHVESQE